MTNQAPLSIRCLPIRARQRGVALVLVLSIVVLVIGLLVAFLNLARTERRAAASFLAGTEARHLADNAVGIVQTQINHAASRGSDVAWVSQPGMVRTYAENGSLQTVFKLYSAANMTSSSPISPGTDLPAATDWATNSAHWVDLNAPVRSQRRDVYPIIDPTILDAGASKPVDFDISGAPSAQDYDDRATMPVRWLYVLRDGRIVAATGSGVNATISEADEDNPVIGRIAFWTDDESCKVNLNTAGVGAFWDVPRYTNNEERRFGTRQPINGEFQRYPGHPAMTDLSAVFPDLSDEEILSTITPRYQWGGSRQGSVDTFALTQALDRGNVANLPLYANVDELHFLPGSAPRAANLEFSSERIDASRFFLTHSSRAPEINLFNLPRISIWPVATEPGRRTAFDDLIAFASSVGGHPYYFLRQSALSPTADAAIASNARLFSYLRNLTNQTVPGFGVRLADKFGIDRDQILVQIWDYIRSTNLFDSRLGSSAQFTANINQDGYGYVNPLEIGSAADPARGFGRSITLSELAFAFICTADPRDADNSPPNPLGLMGSNDPAKNRTLGGVALGENDRRIQMAIIPEFFSPSQGNVFIRPRFIRMTISGLADLTVNNEQLFDHNTATIRIDELGLNFNRGHHSRRLGGPIDYRALFMDRRSSAGFDTASASINPFISDFVTISVPNPGTLLPGTMHFSSGELTVTFETSENGASWREAQIITINPPDGPIPIPNLVKTGTVASPVVPPAVTSTTPATDEKYWWAFSHERPWEDSGPSAGGRLRNLNLQPGTSQVLASSKIARELNIYAGSLLRTVPTGGSTYYTDVVRSMVPAHGDYRLIAAPRRVPSDTFTPLGNWSATGSSNALMHNLGSGRQNSEDTPGGNHWRRHFATDNRIGPATTQGDGGTFAPDLRRDVDAGILAQIQRTGDFDSGLSIHQDGAFVNKPDEGNVIRTGNQAPYFRDTEQELVDSVAFFSPNRMVAGPGMFGSLPTHIRRYATGLTPATEAAWRTLLFRKHPGHPNAVTTNAAGLPGTAPDHLLMDLFWMPVVEPYAISEPFSTAGKVNMNYQLEPFRYITRATAMAAILSAERVTAVPNEDSGRFKDINNIDSNNNSYRLPINIRETLSQFQERFDNSSGRIFLSPTELCDLWLVPEGQTLAGMQTFWNSHRLTGDNMRERPYTTIIPRLTTKSNTFTVHFRVQTIKNSTPGNPTAWNESTGSITSEFRGSTMIERFIDLADPRLEQTDFASTTSSGPTLDTFYRWRVIQSKQFAP